MANVHASESFRCTCGGTVTFLRERWDGPLRSILHQNDDDVRELGRKKIVRLFSNDQQIITLGREPSYLHPALERWLEEQHD